MKTIQLHLIYGLSVNIERKNVKKYGVQYFVYVTHKIQKNLDYIYQDYRKRFGIETSYRLQNICRIRTNNKNPVLRLLFVGISFLLVNIWVNLLWLKISRKRLMLSINLSHAFRTQTDVSLFVLSD